MATCALSGALITGAALLAAGFFLALPPFPGNESSLLKRALPSIKNSELIWFGHTRTRLSNHRPKSWQNMSPTASRQGRCAVIEDKRPRDTHKSALGCHKTGSVPPTCSPSERKSSCGCVLFVMFCSSSRSFYQRTRCRQDIRQDGL